MYVHIHVWQDKIVEASRKRWAMYMFPEKWPNYLGRTSGAQSLKSQTLCQMCKQMLDEMMF